VFSLKPDEYTIFAHLFYNLAGFVYPGLAGMIDDLNKSKGFVSLINYS
jgi:hypothetical protein